MKTYVYIRSHTDMVVIVKQRENESRGAEIDYVEYPVPSSVRGIQATYRVAWNKAEATAKKIGNAEYVTNPFANTENSSAAWMA